jgi:copper chaperone CopZ
MEERRVKIPAISCHHCKMTIERELRELAGIRSVEVDEQAKTALIVWDAPLTWELIARTLAEIGYPPEA